MRMKEGVNGPMREVGRIDQLAGVTVEFRYLDEA